MPRASRRQRAGRRARITRRAGATREPPSESSAWSGTPSLRARASSSCQRAGGRRSDLGWNSTQPSWQSSLVDQRRTATAPLRGPGPPDRLERVDNVAHFAVNAVADFCSSPSPAPAGEPRCESEAQEHALAGLAPLRLRMSPLAAQDPVTHRTKRARVAGIRGEPKGMRARAYVAEPLAVRPKCPLDPYRHGAPSRRSNAPTFFVPLHVSHLLEWCQATSHRECQ
jgi:hypothetical protein